MADEKQPRDEKSLEARVSELEDKLAQVHITEAEIKAYQKVSALLGGQATAAAGAIEECGVNECRLPIRQPVIRQPIVISQPIIRQPIIRQCYECFECSGPLGGGTLGGGGFGGLGG
jgi:hypothetical protein